MNKGLNSKINQLFLNNLTAPNFNVNTNHPLIPNSQEYMFYKKYVSIHSEDRDCIRYPNSCEFEINMPEDLLNVMAIRLVDWTFPANYNTFSILNNNILMSFKINNPYNPNNNNVDDILIQKIFEFLFYNKDKYYTIYIEDGFYNPQQMVTELTNKFNHVVSIAIKNYFVAQSTSTTLDPNDPVNNAILQQEYITALKLFIQSGGYNNFIIVYNNVSQKIWFGNTCDQFTLYNEYNVIKNALTDNLFCGLRSGLPDFSDWGLPSYLGLSRCNIESVNSSTILEITDFTVYDNIVVPRFYYGDVYPGDNGYWLLPNPAYTGSNVNWIESPLKINLMGPAYFYMELEGQNCIDETAPFNVSPFTTQTNQTNGIVNSAFAKIAVPTTPISQWFDRESLPYKFYYPPAERMRRLKIKLRYHNGQTLNFGSFNFSFLLEFTIQLPQMLRESNTVNYSAKSSS
jgi:hypothetical protein